MQNIYSEKTNFIVILPKKINLSKTKGNNNLSGLLAPAQTKLGHK